MLGIVLPLFRPDFCPSVNVAAYDGVGTEHEYTGQAAPEAIQGARDIEPELRRVDNMANFVAIWNIAINSITILGVINFGNFFFGALVAFKLAHNILGAALLVLCPVSLVLGFGVPWLAEALADPIIAARDTTTMAGLAIPAFLGVATMIGAVGFTPAVLAARGSHPRAALIFLATFVSWLVPMGWPALLYWSLKEPAQAAGSVSV